MASNESLKELLAGLNGEQSVFTYLLAGSAPVIAATATTPLDMIKTRLQTQQLKAVASGRGSVPQLSHHHGGGGLGFLASRRARS